MAVEKTPGISETRNSPIRRTLGFIPAKAASLLLSIDSKFNPNVLTISSAVLTLAGSVMAQRGIKGATGVLVTAQVLDAFDGSVAREKNRRNPGSHDTKQGGMIDASIDRFGSAVMGISRLVAAHERGDFIGKVLATISTFTAQPPALIRATRETEGVVLPEAGKGLKDPLGFIGTHTGRTPLAMLSTLNPDAKISTPAGDIRLQPILDLLVIAGNIKSTIDRISGGTKISDPDKIKKIKEDAQFRRKGLMVATAGTFATVALTHFILGNKLERKRNIEWSNPLFASIDPENIDTYYPKRKPIEGLEQALQKLSGGNIEVAYGYGSAFSNDAAPDSLMDILVVVRNPRDFYSHLRKVGGINLGTIPSSEFHAAWSTHKVNFYLGGIEINGVKRRVKLGVIGHDQFKLHARGSRPDVSDKGKGKGNLYLAGRLEKANLVPLYSNAILKEQQAIDIAINQSRIDGAILTTGLLPSKFTYQDFAQMYVKLSYMADRRVERANKASSLLSRNPDDYQAMLSPILTKMVEAGIVSWNGDTFQKQIPLSEATVKDWLKECAQHSFRTNYFQNIWTMGLLNGIGYGLAKVRRARR